MGQIVKRKKKGRPPKSDLARKALAEDHEQESRVRRSLRRRNVRYNFLDYDDFIDDDECFEEREEDEEDEEDGWRREKKVKLVVKLNRGVRDARARGSGSSDDEEDEAEDGEDDDGGRKVVKKRRINDGGREDEEEDEEEENDVHRGADDDEVCTRSATQIRHSELGILLRIRHGLRGLSSKRGIH